MNTKLYNVGCDAKNKPKPISQDDVNNNEWTFLQTASGAIVIIVVSLIITIFNL